METKLNLMFVLWLWRFISSISSSVKINENMKLVRNCVCMCVCDFDWVLIGFWLGIFFNWVWLNWICFDWNIDLSRWTFLIIKKWANYHRQCRFVPKWCCVRHVHRHYRTNDARNDLRIRLDCVWSPCYQRLKWICNLRIHWFFRF